MTLRNAVPCGSCHACCKGGHLVILLPEQGDDICSYEHELKELPRFGVARILKTKPNGDCIYLGENGCTIHQRAPAICRVFDCRRWFLMHSRAERRAMVKQGGADRAVIDAGRARLATLPAGRDVETA